MPLRPVITHSWNNINNNKFKYIMVDPFLVQPIVYSLSIGSYKKERHKEEYKNIILLIGEPVVLSRKSIKYEVETSGRRKDSIIICVKSGARD